MELIVSVGLFMIVVTIAMSAYVTMISLDRKARATNDVVSNLSFAVNSMSRAIRTGSDYNCGATGGVTNDCWPSPQTSFKFKDENGLTEIYFYDFDSRSIYGCINVANCSVNTASRLIDPRIDVSEFKFFAEGTAAGDTKQPRVVFTITGSIKPDPQTAPISFTIESSATQRLLDL